MIPDILALDFDGVLCDGRPEYFETSSRAYGHFWSPTTLHARSLRERFYRLRPVIMSGWEMPLLLRALVVATPRPRILARWRDVRETLLASLPVERDAFARRIAETIDRVRRDWIWTSPDAWLQANRPYTRLATLRGIVSEPRRTVIVTTKEGEFARRILDAWHVPVADVQGKEAGEHKCDNLAALLAAAGDGATLWFVEDRIETLECVVRCARAEPRLRRVRLFLAAWGYTTPAARARARASGTITVLSLDTFAQGLARWPGTDGEVSARATRPRPRRGRRRSR